MGIPTLNLKREFDNIGSEIIAAIEKVCRAGEFIKGPEVAALEQELAEYLGGGFVVGCGSGTDALQLALMALDIRPGQEIITTPFTFVATAEVMKLLGVEPVFVDINPDDYTINPDDIEKVINHRTAAIMPVHLFGQCANMDEICRIGRDHRLFVIEDCAQSFGAKYKDKHSGTIGDIGCFSLFPSKNLGCYGDGGFVFSKNKNLMDQVRIISNHGSKVKYHYDRIGVNSRLDSIQAAIVRVKFKYLQRYLDSRREVALKYTTKLAGYPIKLPAESPGNYHTYNQYCIEVDRRDELMQYLKEKGIGSAVYYPSLLSDFACYKNDYSLTTPVARSVCTMILGLPIDPLLTDNEINKITDDIKGFFA